VVDVFDQPVDGKPFGQRFRRIFGYPWYLVQALPEAGWCAGVEQERGIAIGNQQVAIAGQGVIAFEISC